MKMHSTILSQLFEFIKSCGNRLSLPACPAFHLESGEPPQVQSLFAGTYRTFPRSAFFAVDPSLRFCTQAGQLRLEFQDSFSK